MITELFGKTPDKISEAELEAWLLHLKTIGKWSSATMRGGFSGIKFFNPLEIEVGRLGAFAFEPGWYMYSGSAFGPGGLAARVERHLGPIRRRHWHIDYLRAAGAVVVEIWISSGMPCREHEWASILAGEYGGGWPVAGFGCSDCRCRSHLIYFERRPERLAIRRLPGSPSCKRTALRSK
jgi:Uri superfamily endonuclease